MDDLYFIPKCIKPMFERQSNGTPIRMLGYHWSGPCATPYPSMMYTGTDYFKALKRISKHEASLIQHFLMDVAKEDTPDPEQYNDRIERQQKASFEIAVQQWPKAPKIDAVYFLTHGIQLVNNDKVVKWTDIQVQERDKIFKSYLYSILQPDTYDAETGVLLCILKKFYKPSHLNKMFKRAMALKDESEQIKKANQPPICPYCKTHTMMLHHKFHTCALPSELFYECSKCHSRSPEKLTAHEAEKAAMSIE